MYLVAPDNMDHDHHVGEGDEPLWIVEGDEDVVIHFVAESPIADECNREVAECHHDIGHNNSLPHRFLRWLLWCRRDGGLDL